MAQGGPPRGSRRQPRPGSEPVAQPRVKSYSEVAMRTMTARELKNRTGDALRAVGQGEQVLITRRGKPFALVVPATAAPRESEDDALLETLRVNARRRPLPVASSEQCRRWRRG